MRQPPSLSELKFNLLITAHMTTWPCLALPGPCLVREISVSGNLEYLHLLLISHDSVPAAGWLARAGRGSGSGATQSRADLASCSLVVGLDRGLHVVTWEDSEKYFLKFLHCMDQLIIQYQGRQGGRRQSSRVPVHLTPEDG